MWPEQLCQEKTVILVCYAPCPRFAHDVRLVLRQVVQRRSRQGVDGRCPVHRGTTFLITAPELFVMLTSSFLTVKSGRIKTGHESLLLLSNVRTCASRAGRRTLAYSRFLFSSPLPHEHQSHLAEHRLRGEKTSSIHSSAHVWPWHGRRRPRQEHAPRRGQQPNTAATTADAVGHRCRGRGGR